MEAIKNWWMRIWNSFAEKHPKAAEWFRKGGLFLIFSYVVTFIKFLLLMFLPNLFRNFVGDMVWTWPGIQFNLGDIPITLSVIGHSLAEGGLAYSLGFYTSILFGECINFPLQRSVTFKSKGPIVLQALCHLVATIVVMLIMNLLSCLWNPIIAHFIPGAVGETVSGIVNTVATGGVSMVIIFFVDNKIFAPGWGEKK